MNNRHRGKVNDLVTIALVEGSQIPDPENEFGYATSFQVRTLGDLELV